jgi:hypothetical protein
LEKRHFCNWEWYRPLPASLSPPPPLRACKIVQYMVHVCEQPSGTQWASVYAVLVRGVKARLSAVCLHSMWQNSLLGSASRSFIIIITIYHLHAGYV